MDDQFKGQTLVLLKSIEHRDAVERLKANEDDIVKKGQPSDDTREIHSLGTPGQKCGSSELVRFDCGIMKKYLSHPDIEEIWGPLGSTYETDETPNRREMLSNIKNACKEAAGKERVQNLTIYYTGLSRQGTGDWCGHDADISLRDIIKVIRDVGAQVKYFIEIICDCSYSGHWVL